MTKLAKSLGADILDGKIVIDPGRLKTIISIALSAVIGLCGLVGGLTAVWAAPRRIDAVQQQVRDLCAVDVVTDKRLSIQEQGQVSILRALDDIKTDIRDLRADVREARR